MMDVSVGAADLPASCTLTATCVDTSGNTVATQSFPFTATGALQQEMIEATPKGFKSCQYVGFTSANAAGEAGATVLDTISYTVYSTLPLSP